MKFINLNLKILFCYLITISIILITLPDLNLAIKTESKSKTNSKSKLKSHSKREASLMETINGFFAEKNFENDIEKAYQAPVQNSEIYKPRFKLSSNSEEEFQYQDKNRNRKMIAKNIENSQKENFDQNNNIDNLYKFKEAESEAKNSKNYYSYGGLYDTKPKLNQKSAGKKSKKSAGNAGKAGNGGNGTLSNNQTSPDFWQNKLERKVRKNTKILQEDWFMISSSSFKSNYFPAIKVSKTEMAKIKIDEKNFRINNAYSLFSGKNKPLTEKYFWFRLSGLNFYYSVSVCDTNILGTISMENMNPPSEIFEEKYSNETNENLFCSTLSDTSAQIWKICTKDELKLKVLICQINIVIGIKSPFCRKHKKKILPKNIAIQPMIIIPKPSRHCNEGWNYQNKGEDWECDCKEGKEQSPIDLPSTDAAIDSPVTPFFHFNKVYSKIEGETIDGILKENEGIKLKIWDNTLRILNPDMGKIITVDGAVFKAEEIVIHTPSEHTFQGKKYDAEMQVLFYGQSKGDISKQVVLSFLFEGTPGEYNKFFDSIDSFNFPNAFHKEKILKNDIFIPDIFYNMDDENNNSMKKFSFFTYQGSLTFPPCTENTIMYVASKPIPLSTTTLTLLQEAVRQPDKRINDNKIYLSDSLLENDRKIQPINGRPVFFYNHEKYCGPDTPKKKKEYGHFEKVRLIHENIFYVENNKPSGFPQAFVIGKDEAFGKSEANQ